MDIQGERRLVNRRMISVFLWCFLLPTFFSLAILIMIKAGILPRSVRSVADWLILIFPVVYSVYFLSSQVLIDIPSAFKRGAIATALGQSLKESQWRKQVCENMKKDLTFSAPQWKWTIASYRMDLDRLQNRNRYLTALGGAMFFLIIQGLDSIANPEEQKVAWVKDAVFGWIEASNQDFSQWIALGLFLLLLYLSGSQTVHYLQRYLCCAELIHIQKERS